MVDRAKSVDPTKSKAVILYTSRGFRSWPYRGLEAVRNMPVPDAVDLVRYVETLEFELLRMFPLDWPTDLSVALGCAEIAKILAERHPELDQESVDALVWLWSYDAWK